MANQVFNEIVIDADKEELDELFEQLSGLAAAELFQQHVPAADRNAALRVWGCTGAVAWRFEPRGADDFLVMEVETRNARPVPWVERALGWELGLGKVEMRSRCPEGGFAGYLVMEGEAVTVNELIETEACPAEEFFEEQSRRYRFAADHGY